MIAAIQKGVNWRGTETELVQALSMWHTHFSEFSFLQGLIGFAPFLMVLGISLETLGVFLVLLSKKFKLGAFFLLLFLIPATFLFHPFWFLEGVERDLQIVMFLKNLAIMGGLFLLFCIESSKKGNPNMESASLHKEED